MFELRLDYLRDFDFSKPEGLAQLLADKALPAIITCRSVDEGGQQSVDHQIRLRLMVEGARSLAEYCDVEAAYYERALKFKPDLNRLIVSYHNFTETPTDLTAIYERLCRLPAGVHKIVTQANSIRDTLPTFELLNRASAENRKLIALGMGEPGLITRILGTSRGSYLTYGSLKPGAESAAGQPTCRELNELYGLHRITRATQIAGIIGLPVSHSASPAIHNSAFRALGLDWVYMPLEVDDVGRFFREFVRPLLSSSDGEPFGSGFDWPLRGLSVTIPHKRAVIPYLDDIDETARAVGAVNTIVIGEGRARGYNTDVQGAMEPLAKARDLASEHCAVIGAGGAARAVIYGLKQHGARVTVFARDPSKLRDVGERFGVPILPLDALSSSDAGIIINTTPVGMRGHSEGRSPVDPSAFKDRRIAYDLVYNPTETRFLKYARDAGCETISGIEMLIAQAAGQFSLWTGVQAPLDVMRKAAGVNHPSRLRYSENETGSGS